jgi:hypothetical protein
LATTVCPVAAGATPFREAPGVDVLFSRDNRREQVGGGTGWDAVHVDALDITRGVEAFF